MQRMLGRSLRPSAEEESEGKMEEAKEEDEVKYARVRKTVWLLYLFGFMVREFLNIYIYYFFLLGKNKAY